MRHTRGALAALGLALTLVVGGCTDDPEPRFANPTPTPTGSAPTSSEPSSDPPTSEPTPGPGALTPEETVRRWVDSFNAVSASGDPANLKELSTQSCLQCNQLMDGFTGIYAKGGSITSDGWRIETLKRNADFKRKRQVGSIIEAGASEIVSATGAQPTLEAARRLVVQWTLKQVGERWLVDELAFLS